MGYNELEKISSQRWITEGPNREGVSGYLLVNTTLYYFYEEPGMNEPTIASQMELSLFVKEYDGNSGEKIQAIVEYLKKVQC